MKTLQPLFLMAVLITFAAWLSFQGVSQATSPEVPLASTTAAVRAVVTAHPASAKPAEKKALSALAIALENGNVCETARFFNEPNMSEQDVFAAIMSVIDPSTDLREVFGADGPMLTAEVPPFYVKGADALRYHSRVARLLWTLKMGGLAFTPVFASNVNTDAALTQLIGLGKEEPGNAFYPLMRLMLEVQRKAPPEKIQATLDEINSASSFDSHIEPITRELSDASWENPALYFAISHAYNVSVFPYIEAYEKYERVEKSEQAREALARLMTEAGLKATRSYITGDFEATRYIAGRELDSSRYPTLEELEKGRGGTPSVNAGLEHENGGCDSSRYEAEFFEKREMR
ncbi:MAG: hypothetical protein ACXVB9_10645 [Bdellovibrionota bacterium]